MTAMLREIVREAWSALGRSRMRSFLTMLGIVWGIVAVTLLIAYGSGFRGVLVHAFEAFGKGAVVCWPGQTSEQPGGQRAGRVVRFEQVDLDLIRQNASLVKHACLESVRFRTIAYGDRTTNTAIRGVCPEYGEMRNEVPAVGRWISPMDMIDRRRVVFLGEILTQKLFAGRPAVFGDLAAAEPSNPLLEDADLVLYCLPGVPGLTFGCQHVSSPKTKTHHRTCVRRWV